MNLRRAHPDEAPAIVALMRAAIDAQAAADYDEHELARWHARLGEPEVREQIEDPSERFLVAEEERRLLALAARKGNAVRYLYVHPEAAGRGIARLLMQTLEDEAKQEGLPNLYLEASRNAAAFYRRLGYTEGGGSSCDALCVRMEKELEAA